MLRDGDREEDRMEGERQTTAAQAAAGTSTQRQRRRVVFLCRRARVPKEAECFFVNAHLNKALEEQIWKKKTGFNLANYNMDESISELSICLEEKDGNVPLRVELPPPKSETDTSKVLKLDQMEEGDRKEADPSDKSRLNIEEFECGVQFEGSENSKQEWSFTLYDFDGHGRITKEDLASLLKALYDAVGSSIKLPSNGTKTLKLRLTVGQDNTQIQVGRTSPKLKVKDAAKVTDMPKVKDAASKAKDASSKVKEFSKLNNLTQTPVKCNNEGQGQGQKNRNQLSAEDQQQLVELVQENMDRNHIKQLRRHHSECRATGADNPGHQKRRHRAHCSAVAEEGGATCRPRESQDRRNYYLDLAGVDNDLVTSRFHNTPTTPVAGSGFVQTGSHHRSRSHDVAQKFDNARRESERLARQEDAATAANAGGNNLNIGGAGATAAAGTSSAAQAVNGKGEHPRSRSLDTQDPVVRSPKGHHHARGGNSPQKHSSRFRPVSLPGHVPAAVSPHYHRRHRHREKDHGLAMQQVAEWIEREHSWDIAAEKIVVQRHEHHHVHEHHHHHHYHHYYEA